MLNYIRNIKDTDNNFAILRIKDFICDLFLTIFTKNSSANDISLQDIFSLIQLISDVGKSWNKIDNFSKNNSTLQGWIIKIDSIMKCLLSKIGEVETFVNIDSKFYLNLFEYLNFFVETFLIEKKEKKEINEMSGKENINENEINVDMIDCNDKKEKKIDLFNQIVQILTMLNSIKFIQNEPNTKNLFINLLSIVQHLEYDKQIVIFEHFNNLKYKSNIPIELMTDLYKIYINCLINNNENEKAEKAIKSTLKLIKPNSKEEVEFFILNLYILFKKNQNEQIKEMIEIIFEHKEITIEDIENIMVKISKYSNPSIFIKVFFKKIQEMKNLKFSNSKIVFSFENISKFPNFCLIFLYLFFKELFQQNDNNFSPDDYQNQTMEFLKNISEALLENTINNLYDEYIYLIPTLLHNIITFFIKIEKNNESFTNYFLIEIINKTKNSKFDFWKDFSGMSINIYIEKKDFPKLKAILEELDNNKNNSALYFYGKIILTLEGGIKWNTLNIMEQLCKDLNTCQDFNLNYYIKIFNFIYLNNYSDVTLFSILLLNYTNKVCEFFSKLNSKEETIKLDYMNEKIYPLIDCCYEVIFYSSKQQNFSSQIDNFSEVFELISNFIEEKKYDKTNKYNQYITSSISMVVDLCKLLLDFKNSKDFEGDLFPEFILLDLCKMLNFVFVNFDIYIKDEILQNLDSPFAYEMLQKIFSLFEIFQNLKIFLITYEYNNLINTNQEKEKFIILNNKAKNYQQNFNNAILILKQIIPNEEKNLQVINLLDEKIKNCINSTSLIEEILSFQLLIKIEEPSKIQEYLKGILNKSYHHKKLIFLLNSILFQQGLKSIEFNFLGELINIIINNFGELFNKIYSIEEICNLFKDYVSSTDEYDIPTKIKILKQFQTCLLKFFSKINPNDMVLSNNIEWIYYKVYKLLESNSTLDKTSQDYIMLKSIFEELNYLKLENKSLITEALTDLIMNKII